MEQPSRWSRVRDFVRTHRRRFQLALIAVFVVALVVELGGSYPREVTLSVPLGEDHADVREARIAYSQDRESVREITRRFPSGAPSDVRDTVELSPGHYDVSVVLLDRDGTTRTLSGRVTAPTEGVVRLRAEGGG